MQIEYKDIAVDAKEDAAFTTNDKQAFCNIGLLNSDDYTDVSYTTVGELNQILLDKPRPVFEASNIALWSNSLSGPGGDFETPVTLTVTFSKSYNSTGISIVFDRVYNTYASSVAVTWYSGTTQLANKIFTPDSAVYFCENYVAGYNKVVISFSGTSLPYRYLKITGIEFGVIRVFGDDELKKVSVAEEISLISEEISINTLDFSLTSVDTSTKYVFQKKQPLKLQVGDSLIGCYFVDEAQRTSEVDYSIKAIDYIGLLDKVTFLGGIYNGITAATIINAIFSTANIPYTLANTLKAKQLYGYIPVCTCREAVMQVAFALGAVVDTSRRKDVGIYVLGDTLKSTIDSDRVRAGQKFSEKDKATAIRLTEHTYTPGTEQTELYNGGAAQGLLVTFNDPQHSLSITNGTIVSSGANYAIINAQANCVLTGQGYNHNTHVIEIITPNLTSNDLVNIVSIDKATLISSNNSAQIAQLCYGYYKSQQYIEQTFKVEAEHLGDVVKTDTDYLGPLQGTISSMRYNLYSNNIIAKTVIKR